MKPPSTTGLIARVCAALVLATPLAWADDVTQAASDGFQVTPELLTPTTTPPSATNSSTLGLEYTYRKTFAVGEKIEKRIATCGEGCDSAYAANGQVSATGKVAANTAVNVGDLIDFSGQFGAEYYHLPNVPLPGQPHFGIPITADATANLKVSFEGGPRLSTKQYTYGVSTSGILAPIGGPAWFARITWPTVVLEFARVDPSKDTERKVVDPALSSYERWHTRVGTGIKLGSFDGRNIKFNMKIDYWREVSPSAAIMAADLNAQTYRAFSLLLAGRGKDPDWLITYASGNVPTDQTVAKVWQLGWNWKFN